MLIAFYGFVLLIFRERRKKKLQKSNKIFWSMKRQAVNHLLDLQQLYIYFENFIRFWNVINDFDSYIDFGKLLETASKNNE